MNRLLGLMVVLMVLLDIGEAINIVLALSRQEWLHALLVVGRVLLLNAVGFWILRGLRDEG